MSVRNAGIWVLTSCTKTTVESTSRLSLLSEMLNCSFKKCTKQNKKSMKQTEAPEHWSVSSAGFLWGGGLRSAASCELTGCCWTSWRITGPTCSTAATLSASRPARRRCGSDAPARKSTTSWTWEQRERFLTCCRVFKCPLTLFLSIFSNKNQFVFTKTSRSYDS